MALWVEDPEKQKYLRDYFASINNIALRFIESKELVQKKHKDTWNTLSPEEQEQAIDDYIIPTAVKEKYASIQTPLDIHETSDISSMFPSLQIETGQREVTMACNGNDDSDNEKSDNELSWKDEHSDPFSWETRSQMNMTLPPPRAERQSSQRDEKEVKKTQPDDSVLSENQIIVQIPKPKPKEEKPAISLRKSSTNNSNSHLISKPTVPSVAASTIDETDVNKNKPDSVTEILHELDTRNYGGHLITVTSSIIDAHPHIQSNLSGCPGGVYGRNEIEVKKVNIDEPTKIKPPTKPKSAKEDYFVQEDDDQHLLANAQPCADSSPSADHTRLSGFDFLDNW